jgi:menaquinone-dependent protoporphyrinogen oxidase
MIVVAYASKHGSTEGIAQAIATRLRYRDLDAKAVSVHDLIDLDAAEAVVLGSAVYAGSWIKDAVRFAEHHADRLRTIPVWLFSSGPLGEEVKDEEEQPRQLGALRASIAPREHRVFFGALDIETLSFGERMIVKAVHAPAGDFRDWDAINAWADAIADDLR